MILVDSTIWIEFFKANQAFVGEMEPLLENKQVLAIEPVFAELLYGSRNDKERTKIISYWKLLPRINFKEGFIIESANFANKNNYYNLGIGLIDSVLCNATIENNCLIWTSDKKILNNLDKLYIYNPTSS